MGLGGRTTLQNLSKPRTEGRERRLIIHKPARYLPSPQEGGVWRATNEQMGESKRLRTRSESKAKYESAPLRDPTSFWDASSMLLARKLRTAPAPSSDLKRRGRLSCAMPSCENRPLRSRNRGN